VRDACTSHAGAHRTGRPTTALDSNDAWAWRQAFSRGILWPPPASVSFCLPSPRKWSGRGSGARGGVHAYSGNEESLALQNLKFNSTVRLTKQLRPVPCRSPWRGYVVDSTLVWETVTSPADWQCVHRKAPGEKLAFSARHVDVASAIGCWHGRVSSPVLPWAAVRRDWLRSLSDSSPR
jgi:hypothetical protein